MTTNEALPWSNVVVLLGFFVMMAFGMWCLTRPDRDDDDE